MNLAHRAAGVIFNITMTSLELKRGQSITYQMEGIIAGMSGWVTTQEGSGTRLTATFDYDYEIPGGGLGQVIDKLVVERMNVENLEKSLKSLKALVEGQATHCLARTRILQSVQIVPVCLCGLSQQA